MKTNKTALKPVHILALLAVAAVVLLTWKNAVPRSAEEVAALQQGFTAALIAGEDTSPYTGKLTSEQQAQVFYSLANSAVDKTAVVRRLRNAAELGHTDAMRRLLQMHSDRTRVLNPGEEYRFAQLLAAQGDVNAQVRLSSIYARGQLVPQDMEKALLWAERAAEQDNRYAMGVTASYYREGIGTAINPERAEYWQKKASLLEAPSIRSGTAFAVAAGIFVTHRDVVAGCKNPAAIHGAARYALEEIPTDDAQHIILLRSPDPLAAAVRPLFVSIRNTLTDGGSAYFSAPDELQQFQIERSEVIHASTEVVYEDEQGESRGLQAVMLQGRPLVDGTGSALMTTAGDVVAVVAGNVNDDTLIALEWGQMEKWLSSLVSFSVTSDIRAPEHLSVSHTERAIRAHVHIHCDAL